jgi:hypothetical protein
MARDRIIKSIRRDNVHLRLRHAGLYEDAALTDHGLQVIRLQRGRIRSDENSDKLIDLVGLFDAAMADEVHYLLDEPVVKYIRGKRHIQEI